VLTSKDMFAYLGCDLCQDGDLLGRDFLFTDEINSQTERHIDFMTIVKTTSVLFLRIDVMLKEDLKFDVIKELK
jgi:hypothetical protein